MYGDFTGLRHSPHGECGLKFDFNNLGQPHYKSLPTRGVWIEIFFVTIVYHIVKVTPHTGSVD